MSKKLTTRDFIERARQVHGDKYDYSKVEYVNNSTKVCIICPIHGEFWQSYDGHITQEQDCPHCARENNKKAIFGVGINDYPYPIKEKGKHIQSYSIWQNILARCYDAKVHLKYPTYKGCSVCEEWLLFSNFKKWFDENYVEGWHLDKDILVKGNKIYSSDTCCFVPKEINKMFTKSNSIRGKYPIGVTFHKGKYDATITRTRCGIKKRTTIGSFPTPEDAFVAYKIAKEMWIKEVADNWKDSLKPNVYEAIYNYNVEITD